MAGNIGVLAHKLVNEVPFPPNDAFGLALPENTGMLLLLPQPSPYDVPPKTMKSPIGDYRANGVIAADSPLIGMHAPLSFAFRASAQAEEDNFTDPAENICATTSAMSIQLELLDCIETSRDQLSRAGLEPSDIALRIATHLDDQLLDLHGVHATKAAELTEQRDALSDTTAPLSTAAREYLSVMPAHTSTTRGRQEDAALQRAVAQSHMTRDIGVHNLYRMRAQFEWVSAKIIARAIG